MTWAARNTTEADLAGLLITAGPYGCGRAATAPPRRRCLPLLDLTPGSEPRLLVPFLERPDAESAHGANGVKIPMNVLDFGVKVADSWKRAGDIVESVGRTAKLGEDAEKWVMRNWGELGSKAHAIHVTADTLKDRFAVAVAKEFGDSTLYRAGAGLLDKPFQRLMPTLVENTPLGRIPAIADSVRPVVDGAGNTVPPTSSQVMDGAWL